MFEKTIFDIVLGCHFAGSFLDGPYKANFLNSEAKALVSLKSVNFSVGRSPELLLS